MSKRIKYPKLLLYGTGLLLLWIVIYQFTWSNTLELNSEVNEIRTELIQFEQDKLNSSFNDIDLTTINRSMDSLDFQHEVLAIITKTLDKKSAQIHQFSELQKVKSQELEVQIQPIVLQGEFFSLLRTLNELEQDYRHLNIASASLYVEKNKRKKKNELFMKIYVQKLI
ncbi:MAG: hypothetical protein CL840_14775 [Crocinitomicaceae bacterium]|nr:hypothetical protein [Crocinitomicaceae bacterium]|tara:strand:- start:38808 stop:39314 length:507 start_codon:yes stop_codon:yes gene_type:complete